MPTDTSPDHPSLRNQLADLLKSAPDPTEITSTSDSQPTVDIPDTFQDQFSSTLPDILRAVLDTTDLTIQPTIHTDPPTPTYTPILTITHTTQKQTEPAVYFAYVLDPTTTTLTLALVSAPSQHALSASQSTAGTSDLATLREEIPIATQFTNRTLEPTTDTPEVTALAQGAIAYAQYTLPDFPPRDRIISDLLHFTTAYRHYVNAIQTNLPDQQAWTITAPPDTIETWLSTENPHATLQQELAPSDTTTTEIQLEKRAAKFHTEVQPGDLIFAVTASPTPTLHAIGEVNTPPYYSPTSTDTHRAFDVETTWATPTWQAGLQTNIPIDDHPDFSQLELTDVIHALQEIATRKTTDSPSLRPYLELLSPAHFAGKPDPSAISVPPTDSSPAYWVTLSGDGDTAPLGDQLAAPCSGSDEHDLACLSPGDTAYMYADGEITGVATITSHPYPTLRDGDTSSKPELWAAVDRDTRPLDDPLAFADLFADLLALKDDTKSYPVSHSGLEDQLLSHLNEEGAEYLRRRVNGGTPNPRARQRLATLTDPPTISIESLPEGLYFPTDERDRLRHEISTALASGKHIILSGPPGTGKTKLSKHICQQAAAQSDQIDGYQFTTATAEWSTFDTVGGYMPTTQQANGQRLQFQPRLFLNCLRDGENIQNEWLVIDELNRANIDKALGPLFSVLSEDSVTLPYEGDSQVRIDWVDSKTPERTLEQIADTASRFPMTPSWRLLGTMNTVDKTSLYDLSFAFMRRFNFIHVGVPELGQQTEDGWELTGHHLLEPPAEESLPIDDPTRADQNYAWVWINQYSDEKTQQELRDLLAEWYHYIAAVWLIINSQRTIGPAIIQDLIEQLHAASTADELAFTSAVTTLVFPQLEGLRERDQRDCIDALTETIEILDVDGAGGGTVRPADRLEMDSLRRRASEQFNWMDD
jgi:MoxR-like ATPase